MTTLAVGAVQGQGFKPEPRPFHIDGGGVAFIIKIKNTSSEPLHVTADGECRMRLDGTAEGQLPGGSSGAHTVSPGESWQEIVRLVTWPRTSGRRPVNQWRDTVWAYRERQVQLKPGGHEIEFRCRGEWSDKLQFVWAEMNDDALHVEAQDPTRNR